MKQLFYTFCLLISLLAQACSRSAENPTIEITRVTVNRDTVNYIDSLHALPGLNIGDSLFIELSLDGNGEELNTFIVQENQYSQLGPIGIQLPASGVSDDKNFTRPEEGVVGFENDVRQISLSLEAAVTSVQHDFITIDMFLFSRAECDGDSRQLHLKTVLSE